MITGGLALVAGAVFFFGKRTYGKQWWLKAGADLYFGPSLIDSAYQFFQEMEEGKVKVKTKSQLAANVIKRLTRIAVLGITLALLPMWLLLNQNNLFPTNKTS